MFVKGQSVRCVVIDDELADGAHSASFALLKKDEIYHVEEYYSPEDCARLLPKEIFWQKNGGKIVLEELPECSFFGNRFQLVKGGISSIGGGCA